MVNAGGNMGGGGGKVGGISKPSMNNIPDI
jgi:hypothetical protein